MLKQAASAQRENTPGSAVLDGKCTKQSGPDEEAQKSPIVITMDSPEQASNALPALEGGT